MKLQILLLLICYSSIAFAQCGNQKTVLFFANGMFNSFENAQSSLDELNTHLKKKSNSTFNESKIAYNTDENILLQLFEVYRQKTEEIGLEFWSWLGGFKGFENDQNFKEKLAEYYSEQKARDQDLKIQIKQYQEYLKNGFKIITVAHSQGNFYTNFSFTQINSTDNKMIAVATPTNSVYKDGPYYTFKSDRVVAFIPGALTPNKEKTTPGYFDHKFVDDYLNDEKIGDEIINSVAKASQNGYDRPEPSLKIEDAYYHSDMNPILNWFNEATEKNIQAKPADCVVAYALFNVHRLHARKCVERNISQFRKSIKDCILDLQDKDNIRNETFCPFYYGMDFANPFEAFYPSERYTFFKNNPFCEIDSMNKYKEKIQMRDLEEALSRFSL